MQTATAKPAYLVKMESDKVFRVLHNLPDGGSAAYIVRIVNPLRIECSCPAFRYGKGTPCKHCRFVANLTSKPELIDPPAF